MPGNAALPEIGTRVSRGNGRFIDFASPLSGPGPPTLPSSRDCVLSRWDYQRSPWKSPVVRRLPFSAHIQSLRRLGKRFRRHPAFRTVCVLGTVTPGSCELKVRLSPLGWHADKSETQQSRQIQTSSSVLS